jgi:alpha-1,2-mannosyltransferase
MDDAFKTVVKTLSDFEWLDKERASAYGRILIGVTFAAALAWIARSPTGLDPKGTPIGADFVGFYAASRLALSGRPDLAYDVSAHWAAQKALFGANVGYTAFFYPPTCLVLCLPLALGSYFYALALWLTTTGYAYYRVLQGYWRGLEPATFFAFPAVFVNASHGQNGFLSAALIGGGLLVMDARPALAGLLFGAMAFKPHLALALPFALIFARRWTTLGVAAITAGGFGALSLLIFGAPAWSGFLIDSALARSALENNLVGNEKMQSVFAAVRLWHGSVALAWGLQIATALGALATLSALQRRAFRAAGEAPAIVCAGLLATPFLLDYDLTLLAFPLAWIFSEALRTGFLPFEKLFLSLAFLLPLISRVAAGALGLPLAPLTLVAIFALTMRRALTPAIGGEQANFESGMATAPLSFLHQ